GVGSLLLCQRRAGGGGNMAQWSAAHGSFSFAVKLRKINQGRPVARATATGRLAPTCAARPSEPAAVARSAAGPTPGTTAAATRSTPETLRGAPGADRQHPRLESSESACWLRPAPTPESGCEADRFP